MRLPPTAYRLLPTVYRLLPTALLWLLPAFAAASSLAVNLPESVRVRYHNTDGSCAHCSIGLIGADQNVPAAAWLLWDSEYGRAVRGAGWPTQVRTYCRARGIDPWIVEGTSRETMPWIEWALRTGRGAAVTWNPGHMIAAVGISPRGQWIAVWDNNQPRAIRWVSRQTFLAKHGAQRHGGMYYQAWAVILDAPPAPGVDPIFFRWWER